MKYRDRDKEKVAWQAVVTCIARTAKQKERIRQWQLVCAFQIGVTASGSVWRSWETGHRVPYRATQWAVIREAMKRGWLEPNDEEMEKMLELPFEEIYSLPAAPVLIDDVPDQPDRFEYPCIARDTAAALVSDAVGGIALRRQRAKRPTRLRPTADGSGNVLDTLLQKNYEEKCVLVERWRFAVGKVVELVKKYGRDIVEVALVIAYRRRGYQ